MFSLETIIILLVAPAWQHLRYVERQVISIMPAQAPHHAYQRRDSALYSYDLAGMEAASATFAAWSASSRRM